MWRITYSWAPTARLRDKGEKSQIARGCLIRVARRGRAARKMIPSIPPAAPGWPTDRTPGGRATDPDQVSTETLIWFSAMLSWTAGSASFWTAAKVRRAEQNRRWAVSIRR